MRVPRLLLLTAAPLLAVASPVQNEAATPRVGASAHLAFSSIPVAAESSKVIEAALLKAAPTMRREALLAALSAWETLRSRGEISRPRLTVIDYGLPSTTKRMWVFDLATRRLLFHELVAHGRNSGEDMARTFSNREGSLMTSLGAFVTGTSYNGGNGYSMRLRGMDLGVNDRAEARAIVVHGAPYVCERVAQRLGRLGRSHGCPAVRSAIARSLIDELKGRTLLYAWHPSMGAVAQS